MIKKLLSVLMILCVLCTCIVISDYTTVDTKAADVEVADSSVDYGLVDNVQYGQILHCWNWSFDNIRKNMARIASQGFTAIQTSPIQSSKESTRESWNSVTNSAWVYYQPINFNIEQNSWNALGTKSQFEAMCKEAHKYGVKVIVDTVFNHMANDSSENSINPQIPSDIRDDSSCWYSVDWNCSNWEDRYDVTHNCLSGFPDLNTSSSKVQSYCISFLKECIDAGADGFRFDAAKHIETPSDAYGTSSDFWPNVLNTATYHAQQTRGITPYYYGEILGSPGGGLSISAYTDYMSVTDSSTGNNIRNAIASGNASGACISGIGNGAAPSKTVQWNESHDTYYADRDSMWISNENMKKTWAIVGSRAEVCGLYLARPENNDTTMLGDGDITAWADKEVKAINKFKNYFAGHPEYLASSGNIVYNERGNTGVVLVNATGGSTSVSVPAHRMWDGTYTDAITGNHFNVSNGQISGQIGSSGIAVVYSYPSDVSISERSQKFRTDEIGITATYTEATSGTYTIGTDYSKSYSSGDRIYVGCGLEYGESVDLEVSASGGTTTDTEIATFTKMHPDTDLRIFFDNSVPYWENVYVYLYDESGDHDVAWPGTKLSYDSSYDAYVYEVPEGFETCSVIFNDGADNQVGPYSFDGYTSKWSDNSFYGYNTGITSKLYFKPSEKWKSDKARFAAYIWTGSTNTWVNFSDSDGDGIYSAALPSGTWKNAIFARMNPASSTNNWDNIWNQTGDMGLSNNHNYFMIADGWDTSSGTWSIINESIVGTDSDAYISGSFNAWDTTASPMVYTKYNEAKTTLNIPSGTYTFKLYKGGNWFGNPGTINDTTAGIGWSMCRNDSQNCTLVASKAGEYTFTLNTETLKVTVDYAESDVEPTQVPTCETEPPTEKPTEEPTIPPTDPPTEAPLCEAGYYLVGTLNGVDCWGVESLTEDRVLASNPGNSGEYMLNYTFVEGDEIKVAYCDGYEITKWYGSGDNYSIGSSKAGSGTLYFRPEGNSSWSYTYFTVIKNTVQETVPPTDPPTEESTEPETEKPTEAPTVQSLPSGYYVVGTLNGADCWGIDTLSEDRLLKSNPNNSGEYMLDYRFYAEDEIKVVHFDGSDYTAWYNSSGKNYTIGTKAGNCTVYFRPEGNSSWSYNYFTVIKNSDAVDSTETPTETPTDAPTVAPTQSSTLKVNNIKVEPAASTAVFTWDAIEGATKYWVYKYNESKDSWNVYTSTTGTKVVAGGLTGETTYQFKIIATLANGSMQKLSDADVVEFTTLEPVVVDTLVATPSTTSAVLSWEAVEGAQKYWIYKAFEENGPFYVYDATTELNYTVKRLQAETTYYFKIVPAILSNGMLALGEADACPDIAVTTTAGDVITTVITDVTSTTATISWPAYENAVKYWVIYSTTTKSTSDLSKWSTWAETTDTTYTFKWREPGKYYFFSVVALYNDEDTGNQETVNYIGAGTRMLYSDSNFIDFTPVDEDTVTLTWPDDTGATKVWVSYHDENGKEVTVSSTTSNTITLDVKNYKNYSFSLNALDSTGNVGYLTPAGGEKYHE